MKITISIPDSLFHTAERLAVEQGLNLSELYATAIKEYVSQHKGHTIIEALDAVYTLESNVLDKNLELLQSQVISKKEW